MKSLISEESRSKIAAGADLHGHMPDEKKHTHNKAKADRIKLAVAVAVLLIAGVVVWSPWSGTPRLPTQVQQQSAAIEKQIKDLEQADKRMQPPPTVAPTAVDANPAPTSLRGKKASP